MPITALRLTPPSASAIWLAVWPASHILLERLDPLVGPGHHGSFSISSPAVAGRRPRPTCEPMDAPTTSAEKITAMPPSGVPVIRSVNWGGLRTLYVKEVRRFFKVHLQTIWAPAITTLLFLVIFTVATGAKRPVLVGARHRAVRRFHRARADHQSGDDGARLCQCQFLAAGRQDPGDDRRLSDAAAVDAGAARGAGRRRDDARVHRRVRRCGWRWRSGRASALCRSIRGRCCGSASSARCSCRCSAC